MPANDKSVIILLFLNLFLMSWISIIFKNGLEGISKKNIIFFFNLFFFDQFYKYLIIYKV